MPLGNVSAPARPARPEKPELVPVNKVPTHAQTGYPLNSYLLHTLTHIELNAVDLAWDTVVRFSRIASDVAVFGDKYVSIAFVPQRHITDGQFACVLQEWSAHPTLCGLSPSC